TAAIAPLRWGLKLPDLDSRMQGTQMVILESPDDALLAAVLMKLFADRQLSPTPDTLPYLVRRMDRSFDAAHRVVSALDAAALEQQKPSHRTLAAQVIDRLDPASLLSNIRHQTRTATSHLPRPCRYHPWCGVQRLHRKSRRRLVAT